MKLVKCHCGGEAVLGPGTNRIEQRGAAEVELARLRALQSIVAKRMKIAGIVKAITVASSAAEQDRLQEPLREAMKEPAATPKQLELAKIKAAFLRRDAVEVHCPDCGAWVWAWTKDEATNRWRKATAKLSTLKPCCLASEDVRVDHDGMMLVRCNECNTRHLPLGTRA